MERRRSEAFRRTFSMKKVENKKMAVGHLGGERAKGVEGRSDRLKQAGWVPRYQSLEGLHRIKKINPLSTGN